MVPFNRFNRCPSPSSVSDSHGDAIGYALSRFVLLLGLMLTLVLSAAPAWGQPAPALRAVVPANAAPEAMASMFSTLGAGEKRIAVPGAAWLQLQFSNVQLGPEGVRTIAGPSGQRQSFTQEQIDSWGGLSATFNGAEMRVTLKGAAGGAPCSGASCPGWQMHDNNPATGRLAAAGGRLYQPHTLRSAMTRARVCFECK